MTISTDIKRKHPLAMCEICPLKDKPCAPTIGPKDAKIAFVSRSPGFYEAMAGKPFSGPSGKVLDHLFNLYGVNREDVLLTNVVLCQTDDPSPAAIQACSARLEAELSNTETIIGGGSEAAYALAGIRNLYEARGVVYRTKNTNGNPVRLVVTNNPAMVLREERTYPNLVRDFRLALDPIPSPPLPKVRWTDDLKEARNWAESIIGSKPERLAADIEARGRDGRTGLEHNAEVVCAGFAARGNQAVVFGRNPCGDPSFYHNYLSKLFTIPGCKYVWHNGKYDVKVLRYSGIHARVDEDSLLLSYALDERPGDPTKGYTGHSLEYLLKDVLGYPKYEPDSVKQFKKTGQVDDWSDLYIYNGIDAAGCWSLHERLAEAAINDSVYELYLYHLLRINKNLIPQELRGIRFDEIAACEILETWVWPKLKELELRMQIYAHNGELNPNSDKQLKELYYDTWGLRHNLSRPKVEKKGKQSTDKWVRREILEGRYKVDQNKVHPNTVLEFAKAADEYSAYEKLRGTFLEGLITKQWPNGKIYYNAKIHGTESGRLSTEKPNMQQIARQREGLPSIRHLFLPEPKCVIMNADFSQAELRAIAVLSGDEELSAIYTDTGRSLHKETATAFYGENYTPTQYVWSKNINFGVVYGQSSFAFHQMYGISQKEAEDYIKWWFSRFPRVNDWREEIWQEVKENGELVSPFGHKRRFYLITNENENHLKNEAVNFKPQNIAANLTLHAQCELEETLDPEIAQVLLSVHDSIVLNVREDKIEDVAMYVKSVMEAAPKEAIGWDFPFVAEIGWGPNWGDTK